MNIDHDNLSNAFQMLTERLSNIELSQESIREGMRFDERRHYGEINSILFDWNFKVARLTGIDGEDYVNKPAQESISCAYLTDHNLTCFGIPNNSFENLRSGKYDSVLKSLKIDRTCLETKEQEKGEECVTCHDLGIDSHFTYIDSLIAQEIVNNLVRDCSDWERILITPEGDGIWFWKKSPGIIDDFVDLFQKIMKAWDFHTVEDVDIYDVSPNKAYFAYLVERWSIEKNMGSDHEQSTLLAIMKIKKRHNYKYDDFRDNYLFSDTRKNLNLIPR